MSCGQSAAGIKQLMLRHLGSNTLIVRIKMRALLLTGTKNKTSPRSPFVMGWFKYWNPLFAGHAFLTSPFSPAVLPVTFLRKK